MPSLENRAETDVGSRIWPILAAWDIQYRLQQPIPAQPVMRLHCYDHKCWWWIPYLACCYRLTYTGACTGKYAAANLLMTGNSKTNRVISNGFQSKTYIKVFKLICRIKKLFTWQKKNLLTYFTCHLQDLYCWPRFHLDQLQLVTCVHSPLPALMFCSWLSAGS